MQSRRLVLAGLVAIVAVAVSMLFSAAMTERQLAAPSDPSSRRPDIRVVGDAGQGAAATDRAVVDAVDSAVDHAVAHALALRGEDPIARREALASGSIMAMPVVERISRVGNAEEAAAWLRYWQWLARDVSDDLVITVSTNAVALGRVEAFDHNYQRHPDPVAIQAQYQERIQALLSSLGSFRGRRE